ncbi:MAG TPA: hypothetical protein VD836_19385, partial [Solirubrobacteraceae bacterium]|nr:hypothetical protein [Solirubrobacteraceae bacterium]
HVARAPRDAPLLVLGTFRDAEVRPSHPLAELLADLRRDRLVERVTLEGLGARDVGALIAAHAGHTAPPALVGTVHEHTDGNPFFVEEVLRHLLETGTVVERGGRWTSALTPDEIGVPEGVQEVLARRLARLSDPCRAALAAAAVHGRECTFDVLAATVDTGEEELIGALEEARDAQLVLETEHAGAPGYSFTHALVRHALYSGLSGPRRQRLHARAAAAIEQVEGTAPVAALALHHRLAGSAGDPEKAVDFALRASVQAVARFAWEEAAAHLDGALAVMAREGGRERERADLLVSLGDLMVVVGDLGRQIGALDEALGLYEGLGDEARAARVHSRLGMARSLMDTVAAEHLDVGRAFEHFDAARAVLEQGPPHRALGHLEVGVATAWTYGLRIADGLKAAERGMAIAEAVGDELLWAGAAEAFGWHALVVGRLREGFDANARAFTVADRHRRSFLAFMATNIQGQFTWGLGAPDDAQIHFERPLALAYAGDAAHRRQTVDGIGRCHASRGELDAARPYLPDARATWITHALKPVMDLWDGDLDAVAGLATATLETSRRTGNRWDEWASQALAAKVLALRSAHAEAVPLYEAARAILVSAEATYFELWLLPDLARSLAELGRVGDARLHVARCQAIVGAGEDWRGRAGMVGVADAVVAAAEGEPDSADRAFAAALEVLRRHRLAGEEADLLHQWGRTLELPERLEEAAEAYRGHGAGRLWTDRVEADLRALR